MSIIQCLDCSQSLHFLWWIYFHFLWWFYFHNFISSANFSKSSEFSMWLINS